ncbi:LysR family transcriptional regulator [Roseomonas sp. 18066]|uniref:LysR family transcriptional regulator n=1 Tax=Roseomonas sp. 18066 TaxID=2681412 RepID=UPI001358C409|nr:LysR family transcriptional regulator [Roseomonas sp. 18066]
MARDEIQDLSSFVAVAEERSFTRAAARLGTSQAALSHTVRRLEERLGVRLLSRTTRSVALTVAGERLLGTVAPRLEEIRAGIAALSALREKPAGTIRITTIEHAADTIIWPAAEALLAAYPDLKLELSYDYGLVDIVSERFDAGVRLGEQVAKDMVAVRIGPEFRQAVVGAPSYFAGRPRPRTPRDLTEHVCINLRLPTSGGVYVWEFRKRQQEVRSRVEGRVTLNRIEPMLKAALAGLGLVFLPEDQVREHLAAGRLVQVLADWCPPRPGYHLYYPSRRQPTPAFTLLVEALRYRA